MQVLAVVGGGRPMSQIDACTGYTHWRRPWGWRVDISGWECESGTGEYASCDFCDLQCSVFARNHSQGSK